MRADLRARARSEKSFARKPGKIKPRALYLIVCEDGKSAPSYFNDVRARLRLSTAEVEVCGKECGSAPINVVTFARARRNERKKRGPPPDRVFCVVDVDHHTTLDDARSFAKGNGLELIVSRPCFERWYLLHFERGDRPYDFYDHLAKQLKSHLPDYDKGRFTDFASLWDRIDTALANAQRLRKSREVDPEQAAYTDVDLIILAMREASQLPASETAA